MISFLECPDGPAALDVSPCDREAGVGGCRVSTLLRVQAALPRDISKLLRRGEQLPAKVL